MIKSKTTVSICCEIARANLGTCFIHAGLAKTELDAGKRKLAEQSLGMARSGHDAILRFVSKVEDEVQRDEVQSKLVQLREKLDLLQWQLYPEPVWGKVPDLPLSV